MIVDVHTHVFPRVHGRTGAGPTRGLSYGRVAIGEDWIHLLPPLCERVSHSPEMLIAHMDWVGVDRAVLLQGPFYGECNEYSLDAVKRYPGRLAAAAYVDPWLRDWQTTFERVFSHPEFTALKLEMSELTGFCGIYPEARLDSPSILRLWDELEQRGIVLVLDLGAVASSSYQTHAVRAIAEEHPTLKIVIAHLGQPNRDVESDAGLLRMWEEQIDLGKLTNVWFDTASLPAYNADEECQFPSAARWFRMAVDRIGPEKIMWGTDIPGCLSHATYPRLLRVADEHIQFLSPADRRLVKGGNAVRVFGFENANLLPETQPD